MVYEPREDSELLAQEVKKYARGEVLDVGTGTGIQALTAQEQEAVTRVQATDIDPEAVSYARKQGVDAHQADLFFTQATYDTIISNTPYLPSEPKTPDPALDGGEKGYEWTVRFLEQAKNHLAPNGVLLLLISTRTNPHVIKQALLKNAYSWEVTATKKLFFEELRVYKVTHALPQHPEATYLAKGKRSRVYKIGADVIKRMDPRRVAQEAQMLQKANELGIGPTYKEHAKTYVRMSYVQGTRIDAYAKQASKQAFKEMFRTLEEQARTLDEAGIDKQEMTNPHKHVLITPDNQPVLIDWERARATPKPHNQTQLREYKKRLQNKHPRLFT